MITSLLSLLQNKKQLFNPIKDNANMKLLTKLIVGAIHSRVFTDEITL